MTQTNTQPSTGSYAQVNGLSLYYEIHGQGQPTLLLHGGFGSTGMFGEVLLPQLARGRQVIAVDLQAHGRTADIDRPLRLELMGDDIAALIRQLDLAQADLVGFSMGGAVALRTTIQHPALVRRLVVISVPARRSGWYHDVVANMNQIGPHTAEMLQGTPMHESYMRIAPRPEDWAVLATKMGQLLGQDYDWSSEVAGIKAPTLLAFGDADGVSPAYAAEFFGLFGGGQRDGSWDGSGMSHAQLAILPGTTHYTIADSPALATIVAAFLDTPA